MSELPALAQIVGKTIVSVVVTEGCRPDQQVFLVFDDNSYFELYGGIEMGICLGGGPYEGDLAQVRELASSSHQIVFEATSPQEWTRVKVG